MTSSRSIGSPSLPTPIGAIVRWEPAADLSLTYSGCQIGRPAPVPTHSTWRLLFRHCYLRHQLRHGIPRFQFAHAIGPIQPDVAGCDHDLASVEAHDRGVGESEHDFVGIEF